MPRLAGKVAVVTGAASGIGLAATRLFAQEGASVMAIDLDAGTLQKAVEDLGPSVTPFAADVTREAQMSRAMAEAAECTAASISFCRTRASLVASRPSRTRPIDNFKRVCT